MLPFKRIRKSVLKRWAAIFHPNGYLLADAYGARWIINHNNFVDRNVGVFGDFERAQLKFLLSICDSKVDAFLDIGANFGLYAISAAKRGVADTVLAFEPDPRNAAQLSGNLYLNELTQQVQVHQLAVSDQTGKVQIALHPSTSTGTTRIVGDSEDGTSIESIALDSFLGWNGKNILIKIDIEGHELHALRGMVGILQNNTCILQIECFHNNEVNVAELMASLGYRRFYRIDFDHYFCPSGWSFFGDRNEVA